MNKPAQFTPGPWHLSEYASQTTKAGICSTSGLHITDVDGYGMTETQNQANATLIAAAPAMYEALAKLRLEAIHYRNTGVGKQFLNEAIAQAEQAINQVWGEGNHDTKREG